MREIHRDDVLWALDKPAGILSHPNPPRDRAANALIRGTYDFERELYRVRGTDDRQRQVHLVHRLDQDTSGLILCTFNAAAAALLRQHLYEGEVQKEYRALVVGQPRADRGEWRDRLERSHGRGEVTVRVVSGRPNATTEFRVVERFERCGLTLLSLQPHTGRTHQLRVQAASRDLPIAGDPRYGDFGANRFLAERVGLRHMFLHAWRLRLRHPETGHLLKLQAPLTSRLADPLKRAKELDMRAPRRS